jgi:hypothetical protein
VAGLTGLEILRKEPIEMSHECRPIRGGGDGGLRRQSCGEDAKVELQAFAHTMTPEVKCSPHYTGVAFRRGLVSGRSRLSTYAPAPIPPIT